MMSTLSGKQAPIEKKYGSIVPFAYLVREAEGQPFSIESGTGQSTYRVVNRSNGQEVVKETDIGAGNINNTTKSITFSVTFSGNAYSKGGDFDVEVKLTFDGGAQVEFFDIPVRVTTSHRAR